MFCLKESNKFFIFDCSTYSNQDQVNSPRMLLLESDILKTLGIYTYLNLMECDVTFPCIVTSERAVTRHIVTLFSNQC